MKVRCFIVLCLLYFGVAGKGTVVSDREDKFLKVSTHKTTVTTKTVFKAKPLTTTVTSPFCTFSTTTTTVQRLCVRVTGRRKRRSARPQYLPSAPKENNSSEVNLSGSIMEQDEGESDPRLLKLVIPKTYFVSSTLLTSTLVDLSLTTSFTTTTIAMFRVTVTTTQSIGIPNLMADDFPGVPRC